MRHTDKRKSTATSDVAPFASLLRDKVTPPSTAGKRYLHSRDKRLAFDSLQDAIWREFLSRLKNPVRILGSRKHRIVEVLGTVRYLVDRQSGHISSSLRRGPGNTANAFGCTEGSFLVDLPLLLNRHIVEAFLTSWDKELVQAGPGYTPVDVCDPDEKGLSAYRASCDFHDAVVGAFLRAIRQSVNWKQLRYQVQEALQLDQEVLSLAQQCRFVRKTHGVTDVQYNHVLEHIELYRRVARDNPRLLWLAALGLKNDVRISKRQPLSSLRRRFLKDGCGPRGWRLVANHQLRDFGAAIEAGGRKWHYLVEYVQLHNALDRVAPIPRKLEHLFDEPYWGLRSDSLIDYRGTALPPAVLNTVIDTAARHEDVDRFLTEELAGVLHWLSESGVKLDHNQVHRDWSWLLAQARQWWQDQKTKGELSKVAWECKLGATELAGYRFVPLDTAWAVRQEAVRYHHCADGYMDRCLQGKYRLFAVYDTGGRHRATLGLAHSAWSGWQVSQIRGFANRRVSQQLEQIADSIAGALDVVEEGKEEREAAAQQEKARNAATTRPPGRRRCIHMLDLDDPAIWDGDQPHDGNADPAPSADQKEADA